VVVGGLVRETVGGDGGDGGELGVGGGGWGDGEGLGDRGCGVGGVGCGKDGGNIREGGDARVPTEGGCEGGVCDGFD